MNDNKKQQPAEETTATAENTTPAVSAEETVDAPAEVSAETTEQQADAKKAAKAKKEKKPRSAESIRRLRHGRIARLITIGVIVLAVMFNFVFYLLGTQYSLSIDLSPNKLFSLTEESVAIARSVTSPIEIVTLLDEEVFSNTSSSISIRYTSGIAQFANAFAEYYNALKMYNSYSDGKVTYSFINMNSNPTAVNQYQKMVDETLVEGDILFINGDRCKIANAANDLFSVDYNAYYSTGQISAESTVEKTLASKIKSIQSNEDRVLTLLTGHGESDALLQCIEQIYSINGYDIESVNLTRSVEISEDTVCAIIPAPTVDYSKEEIERLRTWLANDGKEGQNLFVFTNPTAACPNLYEFLKVEYGLEVTDNIVVETDYNRIYGYQPTYPYADIPSSDFTINSAGSANALPLITRQIIPHWPEKTDTSTEYSVNLLTFSEGAKLTTPEEVGASGEMKTVDYDGTIVGMAVAVKDGYQNALQTATSTRITVCGSASLPSVALTMNTVDNENLLLNVMSGMTGVTDNVNISAKSLDRESIAFSTTVQIFVGLLLFTILLPVGLLVIGLIVFLRRRHL